MRGVDPGEQGCRPGGADLHDRGAGALGVGGGVEIADQDPAAVQPPGAARYHGHAVGVHVAVAGDGRGHRADRGQGVQERCRGRGRGGRRAEHQRPRRDGEHRSRESNHRNLQGERARASRTPGRYRPRTGRPQGSPSAASNHVTGGQAVGASGGRAGRPQTCNWSCDDSLCDRALDCVAGGVS
jgi:hypothetical protein